MKQRIIRLKNISICNYYHQHKLMLERVRKQHKEQMDKGMEHKGMK